MKASSFKKVSKVINDHLAIDGDIDYVNIIDNEEEKGEIDIFLISTSDGMEIKIPLRKAKDPQ